MPTETAQPATPEADTIQAQLVVVFKENEIEQESAVALQSAFAPMFAEFEKWRQKVAGIQITSVEQVREMRLARETRLAIKEIRVNGEKRKKSMKEASLRYSRAVDGAFNVLKFLCEPLEESLLAQEKFAERQEEERIAKVKAAREELLKPFGIDCSLYQLGVMPDDAFTQLLEGHKLAAQARLEAARKAENDRIAAENARLAEEKRIREENERLKKEADERAAADKAEREKAEADAKALADHRAAVKAERAAALAPFEVDTAFIDLGGMPDLEFQGLLAKSKTNHEAAIESARVEKERKIAEKTEKDRLETIAAAERKAAAEKSAKEKADLEAKAKADREAKQKADAELKALRDAESARKAKEADDARAAAAAPDADKVRAMATHISAMTVPEMTTPAGKAAADKISAQIVKFTQWLQAQADLIANPTTTP